MCCTDVIFNGSVLKKKIIKKLTVIINGEKYIFFFKFAKYDKESILILYFRMLDRAELTSGLPVLISPGI